MKPIYVLFYLLISSSLFAQGEKSSLKNLAVSDLEARGLTQDDAQIIGERLRNEIVNTGKVRIMERTLMQSLLKEQAFAQSGVCDDAQCQVKMGKMLGVDYLTVGSVGKLGAMFTINIRVLDVQTGEIMKSFALDQKGDIEDFIGDPLRGLAKKIGNTLGGETEQEIKQEQADKAVERLVSKPSAKDSNSKLWTQISSGIGIAIFSGAAYYFESQLKDTNKDMDQIEADYKTTTVASETTALRSAWASKSDKADSQALNRNISIGLAAISGIVLGVSFAF